MFWNRICFLYTFACKWIIYISKNGWAECGLVCLHFPSRDECGSTETVVWQCSRFVDDTFGAVMMSNSWLKSGLDCRCKCSNHCQASAEINGGLGPGHSVSNPNIYVFAIYAVPQYYRPECKWSQNFVYKGESSYINIQYVRRLTFSLCLPPACIKGKVQGF